MKNILLAFQLALLLTAAHSATAQKTRADELKQLRDRVKHVQAQNDRLERSLQNLQSETSNRIDSSDSKLQALSSKLGTTDQNIQKLDQQYAGRFDKADATSQQKFQAVEDAVSRTTIYFAMGSIAAFSLLGGLYLFLKRRTNRDKIAILKNIAATQRSLEEESLKVDNKLIDLLTAQMSLQRELSNKDKSGKGDADHKLALRVANEVVRIQANLSIMSPDVRGYKQINASLNRIRENFAANGYELIDMLNKPYDEGMNAIASFRSDDGLESGKQVITRVIRPQVNHNGLMIQAAQIEVSQN
jgi:TolA-binding protein